MRPTDSARGGLMRGGRARGGWAGTAETPPGPETAVAVKFQTRAVTATKFKTTGAKR